MHIHNYQSKVHLKRERGQALLEFLLLFFLMFVLSWVLLSGVNSGIGERWRALIAIISREHVDDLKIWGP